jgi:hypothetical protein
LHKRTTHKKEKQLEQKTKTTQKQHKNNNKKTIPNQSILTYMTHGVVVVEVEHFLWNTYRVPATCTVEMLALAKKNQHTRDSHIIFDETPHVYYVHGINDYTSCTTFIHRHFNDFDAMGIATSMVRRDDFNTNERYTKYKVFQDADNCLDEMSLVARIVDSWRQNGETQSNLGTTFHRLVELFNNDAMTLAGVHPSTPPEFAYFLNYHRHVTARGWVAFRTEMMVWDSTLKLCGSVDMLYIDNADNTTGMLSAWREGVTPLPVHMVDWKRSREISKHGYGKVGKSGPCEGLPDCNFFHYTLQLNLYKYFVETHYNMRVVDMSILVCHPNNNDYQEFSIEPTPDLIQDMLQQHKQAMAFTTEPPVERDSER